MKTKLFNTLNLLPGIISLFFFGPFIADAQQSWTALAKTVSLGSSEIIQYELIDDKRLGIGERFALAPQFAETPGAKFHIKNPISASIPHFKVEATGDGSIINLLQVNSTIYGIYQEGISLKNYFEGEIGTSTGLTFNGSSNRVSITNSTTGLPFQFILSDPPYTITTPLRITQNGIVVQELLECNSFQLHNNSANGRILVSDPDGNGIWTDASNVQDDDWLSSIPSSDGQLKNLYRGPSYLNVGIGTDNPLNKLHVLGGNILVSRDLNEPPGSINGNIFFGGVVSNEWPNGEWGIEYREHGLNFWKVTSASNPGGNYRLFLTDDGNVGIGTANPISKFQINGDYEKLSVGSLASSSAIQGTSYIGFNAARDNRDQWTVDANSDLSMNGGSVILSDIEGNTFFSCIPALEGASGSSSQSLTDAMVFDNIKMTVASNGNVGIGTVGSIMGQLDVSSPGITKAVINSRTQSQAVLWTGNQNAYMGFGVDGSGTGHIYRDFSSQNSLMSFNNTQVGIGEVNFAQCTNSTHKLFVADGITTEEVLVELKTQWSDYVFDEDYPLMSLADLKEYVTQKNHLPEIPTEEEVKQNGIELGQMNALLLKKIEELTLYVIQQQQQIDELKQEIHR